MKHVRLFLAIGAIASSLAGVAAQEAPAAAAREEIARRIEAYVRPFVERGDLSGNLLVARGDEVVFERSFGMADYELGVPNGPRTKFNVASVTKPMTLIALIRLAEQGKLDLQDPLAKWIPDFPAAEKITVEHLARHRAGIAHRVTDEFEEAVPRTAAQMVELAKRRPLLFEPGERSNYSSGGYSVLARVLELAGGRSYGELLRELVFEPAGMPDSAHADSRALLPGRASSYLPDAGGGLANARLKDLSFLVGAGSVYSTARDLHALLRAVRTEALGPGVRQSFVDERGIDWNGVTSGFRAFADWHSESDVTVVLTANVQSGAANRIRRDVPRLAVGEAVPTPELPTVRPVAVGEDRLRRWEGVYELRPGSPLRVHVEDGTLYVNEWTLVPTGERTFYSPQDYAVVEVVLDEHGRPQRLDWTIDGETYPCPRVDGRADPEPSPGR